MFGNSCLRERGHVLAAAVQPLEGLSERRAQGGGGRTVSVVQNGGCRGLGSRGRTCKPQPTGGGSQYFVYFYCYSV